MADAATSSSKKKGPDHDPVHFDYIQGEKTYKITTFNFGGVEDDYKEVIDALKSDIVCCQEINKTLPKEIEENYHCKSGQQKLKVLVKKKTFPDDPKEEDEEEREIRNKKMKDLEDHQCTVRLNTLIIISWHGKQKYNTKNAKTQVKDVPDEKRKHFNDLQSYAHALSIHYKLPVIIGGDFNLKDDDAAEHSNPEGPAEFVSPTKIQRSRNIDYFYTVFQQFEAVSTPYDKLMKDAHASSSSESVTSEIENLTLDDGREVECPKCKEKFNIPQESTQDID